jgi:hypothetical protein
MNRNQPTNRANRSPPAIAIAAGTEVAAPRTQVSTMDTISTSTHERFKPALPQDRTTGCFIEGWISAAVELLIAVGLVLLVVGTPFLFVAGTIYFNSLVGSDLPNLGQFYGP